MEVDWGMQRAIRRINNESLYDVPVRMSETAVIEKLYELFTRTSVRRSHFITEPEAKLPNEINIEHSHKIYGKELFQAGKDCIVRTEDVQQLYAFVGFCYKKLTVMKNVGSYVSTRGLLRHIVSETTKNMFHCSTLLTENLSHRAVKLENWNSDRETIRS